MFDLVRKGRCPILGGRYSIGGGGAKLIFGMPVNEPYIFVWNAYAIFNAPL